MIIDLNKDHDIEDFPYCILCGDAWSEIYQLSQPRCKNCGLIIQFDNENKIQSMWLNYDIKSIHTSQPFYIFIDGINLDRSFIYIHGMPLRRIPIPQDGIIDIKKIMKDIPMYKLLI